jgi:hypothetical protein
MDSAYEARIRELEARYQELLILYQGMKNDLQKAQQDVGLLRSAVVT